MNNVIKRRLTLREWQKMYKDPRNLIVQASFMDGSDSWQPFSIGMSWQYVYHFHKQEKIQIGPHEKTALVAISTDTDRRRRPFPPNRDTIKTTLEYNGYTNVSLDPGVYYDSLPHYKFVVSPQGNGIDCHRHYEALLAGAIPIIDAHHLLLEKYRDLPVLWTEDYGEITESYLLRKYDEMLDKTYDFSSLFLNCHTPENRKNIIECGNYWTWRVAEQRPYYLMQGIS
jgi:hypothetical protein